jgi:hypothetical protein
MDHAFLQIKSMETLGGEQKKCYFQRLKTEPLLKSLEWTRAENVLNVEDKKVKFMNAKEEGYKTSCSRIKQKT